MQAEKTALFGLLCLLPGQIALAHGPDTPGAGGHLLFGALFDDRGRVQVGFDLTVAPAGDIQALMRDFY